MARAPASSYDEGSFGSGMVNYAVKTIQLSKLGKERFMPEGAVLEDDWEPAC